MADIIFVFCGFRGSLLNLENLPLRIYSTAIVCAVLRANIYPVYH